MKGEHGVICRPATASSDKTPNKNFNWQVAAPVADDADAAAADDDDVAADDNIDIENVCLIVARKEAKKENKASTRERICSKPCRRFS